MFRRFGDLLGGNLIGIFLEDSCSLILFLLNEQINQDDVNEIQY